MLQRKTALHAITLAALCAALAVPASAQGPVVLMSLDAEDGGPDNYHGPSSAFGTVMSNVLDHTRSTASDVLVVGAGKSPSDDVTEFWTAMTQWSDRDMYFVNGADAIADVSFADYALVVVASNDVETPDGGLSLSEHDALVARSTDLADFVNSGGGVWGFMQGGFSEPFGYLETQSGFLVDTGHAFRFITPTMEGVHSGVNEVFEVCCWHDEILEYPAAMDVLAVRTKNDAAIAVGGMSVYLGDYVPVGLDFNPKQVPNKLNQSKGKRVQISINGSEDFDVNDVNVDSLEVNGVRPDKVKFRDRTTLHPSLLNRKSNDENTAGADGYVDLEMHFDSDEFLGAFGSLVHGEQYRVELTGEMHDGTALRGVDHFLLKAGKAKGKDKDGKGHGNGHDKGKGKGHDKHDHKPHGGHGR